MRASSKGFGQETKTGFFFFLAFSPKSLRHQLIYLIPSLLSPSFHFVLLLLSSSMNGQECLCECVFCSRLRCLLVSLCLLSVRQSTMNISQLTEHFPHLIITFAFYLQIGDRRWADLTRAHTYWSLISLGG
jgi:hypothetical protein